MLVLYSRAACHLCEVMAADLRGLGVPFDKVDVDADPRLAARYGMRVPVLADGDGIEICHGRIDQAGLRRRLGLE